MMGMGERVSYYMLSVSIRGYIFSKTSTTQGTSKITDKELMPAVLHPTR